MHCRKYLTKWRHLLKILSLLVCCIFVFVLCFFNGTPQQQVFDVSVDRSSSNNNNVNGALNVCNRPIRWLGISSENYFVLFNYVQSDESFKYNESVTYVTHATFRFLNHLKNVAVRWTGPISVAVYAPSNDLNVALNVIAHLRQCGPQLLRHSTTFHLFYDANLQPASIPCSLDDYLMSLSQKEKLEIFDCQNYAAPNNSYQLDNNLTYPVNVARDIARISAQTKYVLVTDVELYPSINMGPMFLDMIRAENLTNVTKTVYVLPIFEVDRKVEAPETKSQLIEMMKEHLVVPFHKFVCPECHRVPKQDQWLKLPTNQTTMSVFYTTKRHKPYHNWEPIYIGSNDEPLYDGRLNWEGMSDKMTQMYRCVDGVL
ncbi:hypothetical protein CHUAL_006830 [Chamberlinius hualienensis]